MQLASRNPTRPRFVRLLRWLALRGAMIGSAFLLALTPSSDAATGRVPTAGSGYFGGLTSNDWPVAIRLSRNAREVRRAVAAIELSCASGDSFVVRDEWRTLRIRNRRFAQTATGSFSQGGLIAQATGSIAGRLNRARTRISGTWRISTVLRNAAGASVDTCDSRVLRFTVRR